MQRRLLREEDGDEPHGWVVESSRYRLFRSASGCAVQGLIDLDALAQMADEGHSDAEAVRLLRSLCV